MWRNRPQRIPGFIEPCIPVVATKPPAGDRWIHEIKHDGFRMQVRRDGESVRIFTRRGVDWTDRYPGIVAAARAIKALSGTRFKNTPEMCSTLKTHQPSFVIDGECAVCGPDGVADFAMLQSRAHDDEAVLFAFDLLKLGGDDLRRLPLLERKAMLAKLLARSKAGIVYNDHTDAPGDVVFRQACAMELEGIVSKVATSPYRSGQSRAWVKTENPAAPAARRIEAGEW